MTLERPMFSPRRYNPFRLVGGTDTPRLAKAANEQPNLTAYLEGGDRRRKIHVFASYTSIIEAQPAQLMHAVACEPQKAIGKLNRTREALASLEATYKHRHAELTLADTKLSAAIDAVRQAHGGEQ